jgi:AraC-like DNA-binding protein
MIDGKVDHYIEGERYHLLKGSVFIINYNELHMLSNMSDNFERMVVHISRDFIPPFFTIGLDLLRCFKFREQGQNNSIGPDICQQYGFKEHFFRLEKLCRENTPESEVLIKCTMIEMLVALNQVHSGGFTTSAKESSNAVKDVMKYINENLTTDLSLDAITNRLFVTKTYLCHLFKKKTGISINQYITNKRILLADDLISNGMSATEACYKSGYNNYSNFYKAYTKVMGHSPKGKQNSCIKGRKKDQMETIKSSEENINE